MKARSQPSAKTVETFWKEHQTALRQHWDRQAQGIGSPDLAQAFALGSAKPSGRHFFAPLLLIPGVAAALALALFTPALLRSWEPAVSDAFVVDQVFLSTSGHPGSDSEADSSRSAYLYSPILRTIDGGFSRWEDRAHLLNKLE